MPTRLFAISWDDDLGPLWMNKDNLRLCLESPEHIGPAIKLGIGDLTDHVRTCTPVEQHLAKFSRPAPAATTDQTRIADREKPMSAPIKVVLCLFLALGLFFANLFYRVYFVPEVLSDVALKQMDRNEGDTPAVILRTHTEIADWGAFFSGVFFLGVVMFVFRSELNHFLKPKGVRTCGDEMPPAGPPPP